MTWVILDNEGRTLDRKNKDVPNTGKRGSLLSARPKNSRNQLPGKMRVYFDSEKSEKI